MKTVATAKHCGTSRRLPETTDDISSPKSGPKPNFSSCEELLLYLTWLRNRFHVLILPSSSNFTRYVINWTNFHFFLAVLPIWPPREVIDGTKKESFKTKYPTTRCIIDCIERFCQKPSSLIIQSCMYSLYKENVTYKGLFGIAQ